jgi:hypothetical protein
MRAVILGGNRNGDQTVDAICSKGVLTMCQVKGWQT